MSAMPPLPRLAPYVGLQTITGESGKYLYTRLVLFSAPRRPADDSWTVQYEKTVGPFDTVRGAKALIWLSLGSLSSFTVKEAERVGKQYNRFLKTRGDERMVR